MTHFLATVPHKMLAALASVLVLAPSGAWLAEAKQVAGTGGDAERSRPNIVVILADDLGFSDLGSYGAVEIETPKLDRLAEGGQRFTQFYNAARCSPSRASLLTGLYPHQAGVAWLAGDALGGEEAPPGYTGHLNDQSVTAAEVLGRAGYETMMVGKWHLGNPGNDTTPWQRGFDRYFGTLVPRTYWKPGNLVLDGEDYDWSAHQEEPFFRTDAQADFAVRFIEEHQKRDRTSGSSDRPFFMYLAFKAPHFPLQEERQNIREYRDVFKKGWDALREERHRKLIAEEIIPAGTPLAPRDPSVPAWSDVPPDEQRDWATKMAVYAALVDHMDRSIGRVVERLEQTGELRNTLLLFLSDNGASAEGIGAGSDQIGTDGGAAPGPPDTFQGYLMPWANASDTPFRMYKHFTQEGGIATPLIAHWPAGMPDAQEGTITDEEGHVMDIMATALDAAGVKYPDTFDGRPVTPMEGKSLLPVFKTGHREGHEMIFWEHEGHRAVREGRWKLVSYHGEQDEALYQWWRFSPRWTPRTFATEWHLYDLEADRTELNDVAAEHPERVRRMAAAYDRWAARLPVRDWSTMQCRHRLDKFNRLCATE